MEANELLKAFEERLQGCVGGVDNWVAGGAGDWAEYPVSELAYGPREGCVNEGGPFWDDDVLQGVITTYRTYYRILCDIVARESGVDPSVFEVYVDPSYEDESTVIILRWRGKRRELAFVYGSKAWNFCWGTPEEMMEGMMEDYEILRSELAWREEK